MHIHTLCLIFVPDMFLSPPDAALALSRKRSVSPSLLIEYIGKEFPGIHVESVGGGIGTIVVVSPSLVIYCISASNTFYRSRIHSSALCWRQWMCRDDIGRIQQVCGAYTHVDTFESGTPDIMPSLPLVPSSNMRSALQWPLFEFIMCLWRALWSLIQTLHYTIHEERIYEAISSWHC